MLLICLVFLTIYLKNINVLCCVKIYSNKITDVLQSVPFILTHINIKKCFFFIWRFDIQVTKSHSIIETVYVIETKIFNYENIYKPVVARLHFPTDTHWIHKNNVYFICFDCLVHMKQFYLRLLYVLNALHHLNNNFVLLMLLKKFLNGKNKNLFLLCVGERLYWSSFTFYMRVCITNRNVSLYTNSSSMFWILYRSLYTHSKCVVKTLNKCSLI